MASEWRGLPSAPDYEVHPSGRVRRRAHVRVAYTKPVPVPPQELATTVREDGYVTVKIGKQTRAVHLVVAEAFLGPQPAGTVVDHRNGERGDNRVENLRYLEAGENTRVGRAAKLDRRTVARMVQRFKQGRVTQADVATEAGVTQQQASRVLRGLARPNRGG